ncbi:MAG: DNA mismatch repair protein [Alyxoria varia]|nr:MAG: DNA mismatch repair protein [Alyxoria varia]
MDINLAIFRRAEINDEEEVPPISRIVPLPDSVAAKVKGSTRIIDLADVVVGLLKNSLDAQAQTVDVVVSFAGGSCTIEDDGTGIALREFRDDGGLLKPFTQNGQIVSRLTPAPPHHELTASKHGTIVLVRNLFGNMPVRTKHRALVSDERSYEYEWNALIRSIAALLLGWHRRVTVCVKEPEKGLKVRFRPRRLGEHSRPRHHHLPFDRQLALGILTDAGLITSDTWSSWVNVTARSSQVKINGAICMNPAPSKEVQFICLAIEPLMNSSGANDIYEEVNRIFASSRFGLKEDEVEMNDAEKERRSKDRRFKHDGYTLNQLRGGNKGVDRWPMFCLVIMLKRDVSTFDSLVTTENSPSSILNVILDAVKSMVVEWLEHHKFRPRRVRRSGLQQHSTATSAVLAASNANHRPESASSAELNVGMLVRDGKVDYGVVPMRGVPSLPSKIRLGSATAKKSTAETGDKTVFFSTSSGSEETEDRRWGSKAVEEPSCMEELPWDERQIILSHGIPTIQTTTSTEVSGGIGTNDEFVTWKDPSSNKEFMLNSRSGVMHEKRVMPAPDKADAPQGWNPRKARLLLRDRLPVQKGGSSSQWLHGVLDKWDNPVFPTADEEIPVVVNESHEDENRAAHGFRLQRISSDVGCDTHHGRPKTAISSLVSARALKRAEVIAQIENKYILVKVGGEEKTSVLRGEAQKYNRLVIIDQHAADERCKVEALLNGFCAETTVSANEPRSNLGCVSRIPTSMLEKGIEFCVSGKEGQLLKQKATYFARWGILYDLTTSPDSIPQIGITVRFLPMCIAERCSKEVRLIIDLLRAEAWGSRPRNNAELNAKHEKAQAESHPWLRGLTGCPQQILDMINSRACRSAIMFNDVLSRADCQDLVSRLAECALPFQCAHGRPSMIPLVDLEEFARKRNIGKRSEQGFDAEQSFVEAFKRWKTLDN